jgi:hypothetical protein
LGEIAGPLRWRQGLGERPDLSLGLRQGRCDGKEASHHPLDIAVDWRCLCAEGDRGDGGCRIAAHARQFAKLCFALGKLPAVILDDGTGARMEIPRAGVIAEPCPSAENLAELGEGKRCNIRPAAQEQAVARQHRLDRGLLQHDFTKPDFVRVGYLTRISAPRQIPPFAVVPAK